MNDRASKQEVLAAYQASPKTTKDIARAHHISTATITIWAKGAGIPLRGQRRRNRTVPCPHTQAVVEPPTVFTPPVNCLSDEDLTGDIERIITRVVTPYLDPSNPMLQLDELRAECRAKLAKIIHDGRLAQCPTRGKVFAFVKTSFRNHVRSLVQKYAFTAKRTGVEPPTRQPGRTGSAPAARKVAVIRLDDLEAGHQVGRLDDRFGQVEALEELFANLAPSDCIQLNALMEEPSRPDAAWIEDDRWSEPTGEATKRLLGKCREILMA